MLSFLFGGGGGGWREALVNTCYLLVHHLICEVVSKSKRGLVVMWKTNVVASKKILASN